MVVASEAIDKSHSKPIRKHHSRGRHKAFPFLFSIRGDQYVLACFSEKSTETGDCYIYSPLRTR